MRALSSIKNRDSSQLAVSPSLSLLPYTLHSLFDHHFPCHSWSSGTELATLHPTGLVQLSAQLPGHITNFDGPWSMESILMGRIFEGEDFCLGQTLKWVSAQGFLFSSISHFIKNLITYLNEG